MIQHFNATTALDVHSALAGRNMAGAKADIQRCFDSVDFGVAFLVFDHLGAPAGLTQVLRFFYAGQTRWFNLPWVCPPFSGPGPTWPAARLPCLPSLAQRHNGDLVSRYGPGPPTDWFGHLFGR